MRSDLSRRAVLAGAAGGLAISLTGAADEPKDIGGDVRRLLGTWTIVAQTVDGEEVPAKNLKAERLKVVITEKELSFMDDGYARSRNTWRIDATTQPKQIDITITTPAEVKGETTLGIYRLDGDSLTLCLADRDRKRPAAFESKRGSGIIMHVMKRDARPDAPSKTFGFCLNTSTVRDKDGKSRPITELIDIAAKAGYAAIEPWISELDAYQKTGGSLKDLRKRITDAGLVVPDVIGFAEWIVEDEARRKKGLEQAKRDMGWAAEIGSAHVAAPPVGATGGASKRDDAKFTQPVVDLVAAADRYRALMEVGEKMGVTPIVEVWGFSKTLRRLGEALLVAVESGNPRGCVLPDVYHLYKGGSDFAGLPLLSASAIGIFHVNDYPKIARDKITDADRVFPGDGIAPLKDVFATLRKMNYSGFVSLELFNRDYWKQNPLEVAKTGLAKMKAVAG